MQHERFRPMFNELFFFTYIIAGFVGFLAILLAALLIRHWSSGNKQLLAAIRNFMICTAFTDALYFYFNYTFLKTGVYTTQPLPRVLDSFTFIGQTYFWAAYIREKCQLPQEKRRTMFLVTLGLCIFCLITNLASYGFFMDGYYFAPPGPLRVLSIIIELLLMICLTFLTVWHVTTSLFELVQKKIRLLVTLISVFISVNGAWNGILSLILMTGTLTPPRDLAMDPTGFFLLLINLFTVLLIYQEDFFALFRIEQQEQDEDSAQEQAGEHREAAENHDCSEISEASAAFPKNAAEATGEQSTARRAEIRTKKRLDFIAHSHSLTQREREVLELAYRGMTNPEIAEELIISKYTVKRHMHNIFEKLDISTRMELIHLINSENGPGGPL